MKKFATNAIVGFLGGAIAAALWSIITNYIRLGHVPLDPLLFWSTSLGAMNAIAFAGIHAAFKVRPTLTSSVVSAGAPILFGFAVSFATGGFVGWSLLSVGAIIVLVVLIGGTTRIIAAKMVG